MLYELLAIIALIILCILLWELYRCKRLIQQMQQKIVDHQQLIIDLEKEKQRFEMICKYAPVMIDSFVGKHCVLWNQECEKQLGYSFKDINSHNDPLALTYPDPKMRDQVFADISKRDGLFREYYVRTKNGKHRNQMWANFQTPGGDIISFGYDITERKAVEDALHKSEELNQRIIESFPGGIVEVALNGAIRKANAQALKILGLSYDNLTQSYVKDFDTETFWEDGSKCPMEEYPVTKCLATGKAQPPATIGTRKPNGQISWAVYTAIPLYDEGKTQLGALVTFIDITQRKKIENERLLLVKRVRDTQKMEAIGTLAGGVAHDFNNILAAMMGYVNLVADSSDDDIIKEYLQQVLELGLRAKKLIQQILTFSRRDIQDHKPLLVSSLVKEVLKFMRSSLPSTVEIRTDIPDKQHVILASSVQFHQVLVNLCTNAGYAMRDCGGVLTVSLVQQIIRQDQLTSYQLSKSGEYIKISVHDTGTGMDAEILERVLEPFFTTKPVGEGTGMGLSIVHGIIKDHQGTIWGESKPDQGTTFHMLFPATDLPVEQDSKLPTIDTTGKEHILLIDDEENITIVFSKILERQGYKVTTTTSSLKALELVKNSEYRFDLVLTDQTMPEMIGTQLSKEIAAIYPELPIILITGYNDPDITQQANIRKVLEKPIIQEVLFTSIRQVLCHAS